MVVSLYLDRSSKYYFVKIIIPTILFTYVSFGLFLLDFKLGERLGFGMNALLIIVAQEIITNDHIPISDESLWITWFIQISTYFTFAALLESIFVAWIYFKAGRETNRENEAQSESMDDGNSDDTRNKHVEQESAERSKDNKKIDLSDDSANYGDEHKDVEIDENRTLDTPKRKRWQRLSNFNSSVSRAFRNYYPSRYSVRISRTEKQARKLVGRIDFICLVGFPILYSIFLILMFTVGLNSMDDKNDSWMTGVELNDEL